MATLAPLSLIDRLRQRADALPLDRAPLRRAGLLTVLLIALLVLGKVLSPTPATAAERQDLRPATEEVSAPRSSTAWTGGRVLAILLFVTAGGMAYWLHRRAGGRSVASGSTLQVLETHPLGPGQSLRLVACGEEVLLLSVASEGTTLLRHWPRETFEAEPVSFASALADLVSDDTSSTSPSSPPLARDPGEEFGGSNEPARPDSIERRPEGFPTHANTGVPRSADRRTESRLHGDESIGRETVGDELATPIPAGPPEPTPVLARGTLFPARAHAPHQFDVRHG